MKDYNETMGGTLRLVAYWITVLATWWSLAHFFFFACGMKLGRVFGKHGEISSSIDAMLVSVTSPLLIAALIAIFAITRSPLSSNRMSWINKVFGFIRKPKNPAHKNQFFVWDVNFNYLSILIIVLPLCCYFAISMTIFLRGSKSLPAETILTITADFFGFTGTLAMTFFLIPVARHSVLLSAMGWSPVHALRLHIWAGFFSFFLSMVHGLLYAVDWVKYQEKSLWDQIIPDAECWQAGPVGEEMTKSCRRGWYNFTGIFCGIFFIVLCATSLNYVRRRYYRIFYIVHVTFGSLLLLMIMMHWNPIAYYVLPSTVYYLASTTPVLVQALASRFRGGVKITSVTPIPDGGGCVEVRIATEANANQALDERPGSFVKLCVPSISLVWHPFTVYKHVNDPRTVRFLFRPMGPFTKQLSRTLTAPDRPITILDGFYRGGERIGESLQHDHVTIVAGGVAITPFLSMIPALLHRLASSNDPTLLKKITLHWACREHGLYDFVFREYIAGFMKQAEEASIVMTIKVYHTGVGCEERQKPLHTYGTDIESDIDHTMDSSSSSLDHEHRKSSESEGASFPASERSTALAFNASFDMEVARLMPGRFHNPLWNLPAFVWLSFTILLGYHIIIFYYNAAAENIRFIPARIWGTLISVAMCVSCAAAAEFAILKFRRHWPSPKADDFAVSQYFAVDKGIPVDIDETFEDELVTSAENSERRAVVTLLEHAQGRPTVDELFAEAREANAPGIFTCGPVTLMQAIVKEAGKENSSFGYTRYCIYGEPFEM